MFFIQWMGSLRKDVFVRRNRKKGIFGLGRRLCPLPVPMAVCKPKMIIAPIVKKLGLGEKMRGAWGRRWTYRWAKIKKWFQPCSYGLPPVTDFPPMPQVKSPRRDNDC